MRLPAGLEGPRAGGWGIETGHERVRDTHVASSVVDVLRVATDGGVHSLVIEKKIDLRVTSYMDGAVRWSSDPGDAPRA